MNQSVCARLLVAIALVAAPIALLAQETTALQARLAVPKPLLIVPPDYPSKALAERRGAEIRMRGTITTEGTLESVAFSNDPSAEDFVEAIRAVMKNWRFVPGVDNASCSPVPLEADVYVWFEIKDDKPAIFVSAPKSSDPTIVNAGDPRNRLVWYRRPKPTYPMAAWRAGVEGVAHVLVRVSKSGEIIETNTLASSPVRDFGDEAVHGLRRAKYQALDPEIWKTDSVCALIDFLFCIDASAEFPSRQCAAKRASR
jgi:TonB family protein